MAVGNTQPPGNAQQSSSVHVADRTARAKARTSIGLDPERATAPDTYLRPPDETSRHAQWLLVVCVAFLGLAVLLLLLSPLAGETSLAYMLGTRSGTQTGATAATPPSTSPAPALPAYLSALPGFQLWLTDDFAAPSQIAIERIDEGATATSLLVDRGVFRLQTPPNQMGWTLFDLAQNGAYHLETSATVDTLSPDGAGGVIARFDSPGNFYLLSLDGAGVSTLQLWLDGEVYTLQSSAAITNPAGQANRLAVEDDGSRLRFFVNQVLVAEILEPQLPFGRPGIAAIAAGGAAAIVDYDWMAIYRPQS